MGASLLALAKSIYYTVYVIVANGRRPNTSISDWSFRGALLGFRKDVEAI